MASSTITNTITNITKSNIILEKPADWHEWMIVINHKAQSGEVKQLIDPDLTTEPVLLKEPDRPKPSDIKEGVTTTVALRILPKRLSIEKKKELLGRFHDHLHTEIMNKRNSQFPNVSINLTLEAPYTLVI